VSDNDYVFFEGDDIDQIYFLKQGQCFFVLPKYNNYQYIEIDKGQQFGVIDIIACTLQHDDFDIENWIARKDLLHRQFTVLSYGQSTMLTLSIMDFNRMKCEFLETHD
jgi:hypothetical protein